MHGSIVVLNQQQADSDISVGIIIVLCVLFLLAAACVTALVMVANEETID